MTLAIKKAIEGDELLKEQEVTDTGQDKNSD